MARIVVDTETLRLLGRELRHAVDVLLRVANFIQSASDTLDWEVRRRTDINSMMMAACARAVRLRQDTEMLAEHVARTVRAFEDADGQGVFPFPPVDIPLPPWPRLPRPQPWPLPEVPSVPIWPPGHLFPSPDEEPPLRPLPPLVPPDSGLWREVPPFLNPPFIPLLELEPPSMFEGQSIEDWLRRISSRRG